MLLKVFNLLRSDRAAAREFVERDGLSVDRRLDVVRKLDLSDEEIAILLREDNAAGLALIRAQLEKSSQESGLAESLSPAAMAASKQKLEEVIVAVEEDIRAWLATVDEKPAWPGRPGPFAEHVSPALIDNDVVNALAPIDLRIEGWLFNPHKDPAAGRYRLVVKFYKAGSDKTADSVDAEVLAVDGTFPRSTATVRVILPAVNAGEKVGTYDLLIYQRGDANHPNYPKGSSRLAAALTVCKFEVPFP